MCWPHRTRAKPASAPIPVGPSAIGAITLTR